MYGGRAGRDYITRNQPDNRGAELGTVVGMEGNELVVSVTEPIGVGDGLGFEHPEGTARGNTGFAVSRVRTIAAGDGRITQAIPADERVAAGWVVVRSAQASLLSEARASFAAVEKHADAPRVRLDVAVSGTAGLPLTFSCTAGDDSVTLQSAMPLGIAEKRPLDTARLREQLGRLGETPFVLGALDVSGLGDNVFLPVSELNELRQLAVKELLSRRATAEVTRLQHRASTIDHALVCHPERSEGSTRPLLVAEVFSLDAAREAIANGADEVSLDLFLRHPTPPVTRVKALIDELAAAGKTLRLRTPTIVRPGERKTLDKWLALGTPIVSGHLGLVAELARDGRDVVADYAVNCFNQHTAAEVFRLGARRIVPSIELTVEEMAQVSAPWQGAGFEVFVYGRPEGMTLEHCVLSAAFDREVATCRDLCVQKHPNVELTDPAGYVFPVATDSACRNRLLHSRPVDASEYLPALWRHGFRAYRLVFNVPADPVAAVTAAYRAAVDAVAAGDRLDVRAIRALNGSAFTRGHFARAV
jgi:putative protease